MVECLFSMYEMLDLVPSSPLHTQVHKRREGRKEGERKEDGEKEEMKGGREEVKV